MSNCLPEKLTDGGIFNETTIIKGTLVEAILQNPSITGGITIDAATATQLAEQLCEPLNECIDSTLRTILSTSTIDKVSFTNAVINGLELQGLIKLNADAQNSVYQALQPQVVAEINSAITAALAQELTNIRIKGLTVSGSINIDENVTTLLSDALADTLATLLPFINKENGTATGLTVTNGVLNTATITGSVLNSNTGSNNNLTALATTNTSFSGTVGATPEAINNFAQLLSAAVLKYLTDNDLLNGLAITNAELTTPSIIDGMKLDTVTIGKLVQDITKDLLEYAVTNNLFNGLDLSGVNISGAITLDETAIDKIAAELVKKAYKFQISEGVVNNSTGTGNSLTTTSLTDTTLKGNVFLDTDAITALCKALKECMVSAVTEELSKLCTPMLGSDKFPPVNEGEAISTQYYGTSQNIRLGTPTGFLEINGYAVPCYAMAK